MKQNKWVLAAVAAAMLAAAPTGAQDMMKSDKMMSPVSDYSVLNKAPYAYFDLLRAKRYGYSETEVATIAKIAHLTGWSFESVLAKVRSGTTFGTLASDAGLRLADVRDVDDEKEMVANYMAAYESTGKGAMMMGEKGMMPGGMTMTPPMAPMKPAMAPMATSDIVDTAIAAGSFKTLVRLVQAAGLVDTLKGPGPFTVFAPTDAAFAKLPAGTLETLALPENADKLKAILTYHVLPAKVDAKTAMSMSSPTSPPTVEGDTLQVTTSGGKVMINDATVVMADVMASNGIIHAIDTVLMPPAK